MKMSMRVVMKVSAKERMREGIKESTE